MFSAMTNQISGMVAQKLGKGGEEGAAEGEVAEQQQQQVMVDENGEEVVVEGGEGQQGGSGLSGMAQGLMAKAMSAKQGIQEKAGAISAEQVKGMGMGIMQNVTSLIPGRWERFTTSTYLHMVWNFVRVLWYY